MAIECEHGHLARVCPWCEWIEAEKDHKTRIATLESQLAEAQKDRDAAFDKAIRFDLDQGGIAFRERDAVELVELRAKLAESERTIAGLKTLYRDREENLREARTEWDSARERAESENALRLEAERTISELREPKCPASLMCSADDDGNPAPNGWHYWATEYPDEGVVGPFESMAEAIEHGEAADYTFTDWLVRDYGRIAGERDEAKQVAVWAVRESAWLQTVTPGQIFSLNTREIGTRCDGSDADIYRALKEAMKGGE